VLRLEGRTPVIFFDIPATKAGSSDTVLLYGHLDKQPEFNGWRKDLGPWTPKYENGLLYGRGGADDGYAVYAAITAIEALDQQGIGPPALRGPDRNQRRKRQPGPAGLHRGTEHTLGNVGLVVCLDSGAGNYDQLWLTTSLRGMVSGVLKVEILTEGIHSGDASGLVPSSFRILRQVLDRLEDSKTGQLLPESFHCQVPAPAPGPGAGHGGDPGRRGVEALPLGLRRRRWAQPAHHHRPGAGAAQPHLAAHAQRDRGRWLSGTVQQRRQRAAPLHRLQAEPAPAAAGGRPPGQHAKLKALLEDNAPYNAKVTFQPDGRAGALGATGWDAPRTGALAGRRAQRGLTVPLRRAGGLHRPGRHDSADEHAGSRASRRRR
jgi:hypothetical protein